MQETKQMPATREADREGNGHCLPSRASAQREFGSPEGSCAREEPLENDVVHIHAAVVAVLRRL